MLISREWHYHIRQCQGRRSSKIRLGNSHDERRDLQLPKHPTASRKQEQRKLNPSLIHWRMRVWSVDQTLGSIPGLHKPAEVGHPCKSQNSNTGRRIRSSKLNSVAQRFWGEPELYKTLPPSVFLKSRESCQNISIHTPYLGSNCFSF